jgi:hypothetical protein
MLERGGYAGYTDRVAAMLAPDTRVAVAVHFPIGSPKFAYLENGALVCQGPGVDSLYPVPPG